MSSTLVISNFKTGYETDREAFNIGNDAFPVLNNAYIWRGRIRKKRGVSLLGRLQRTLIMQSFGTTNGSGVLPNTNIISTFTLESTSQITPGSISITIGAQVFTDPALDGNLTNGTGGTGKINYSTGVVSNLTTDPILITTAATITFGYYPDLPVMGLEDWNINFNSTPGITNAPLLVAFDTKYSYQLQQPAPNTFYDVTYYKNTGVHFTWSGTNYQQFWSTNFQGALWVTNAKPGIQFMNITGVTHSAANTAGNIDTITVDLHGFSPLSTDYVFINEVKGVVAGTNTPNGTLGGLNGQSGKITWMDANHFTLPAPYSDGAYESGGVTFYLTRSVSGTDDGIRWYDGDPTVNGVPITNPPLGWVNFSPPLDNTGITGGNPEYLVGAKIIIPFKDRILFFGTYRQKSTGPAIYNPNQMVCCEAGTAYYAQPVPFNQNVDYATYFENVVGRGFRINAPIMQEIITVTQNEDVLICGFDNQPMKLISTGDDSLPFLYQTISSELGSDSTFSGVSLDSGPITIGTYGLASTTQNQAARIDTVIPDQVYDINASNFGSLRVTAIRDYRNEFIYFTYPSLQYTTWQFPNKTLLWNYRENNYATFDENYTHYGYFRPTSGRTWATLPYGSWARWTDPWNYGSSGQRFPFVIAGNQQGFVMRRDVGVVEAPSQYISTITGTTFTSPAHGLKNGDFLLFSGLTGDATITALNGLTYKIRTDPLSPDTFVVIPLITPSFMQPIPSGAYTGGGVYARLTNIQIQTKQFNLFWDKARKTRLGTQRFLLETTQEGAIQVNLFMNQDDGTAVNDPLESSNCVYTNVVLTSPEPEYHAQQDQSQIWHRMSNSFIGDSVQLGFVLSDSQMYNLIQATSEVTIHAIAIDLYPGPILY